MNPSDKKTVLFYTDTLIIGGAENQMYLLAKFLNKEKYNVMLVCSDYKHLDEWTNKFEQDEIEVIKLNVMHKHDPRHYFQLKELIKHRNIDLIHIHVWNPASCRYAFMASSKYNVPTIVTEHDPFELPKLKSIIKQKLLKKIKHVIAVSDANRTLLLNLFPQLRNRVTVVHNGIDVTWFESQLLSFSDKQRKEYREKHFSVDDDTKVILSVAELHERKGLHYLIQAIPELLEKEKNFKVVIAGSGPQQSELEKLADQMKIKKYVEFLGFRKNIPHLMAASDIFVLPSEKEAFGLVLLEAQAAKLPIVATKVGGIPEIIEHKKNGLLVPPHHPEKLAGEILKFFNDDVRTKNYTEEGYKTLKENFDAKMMAKNTEEIYDRVL